MADSSLDDSASDLCTAVTEYAVDSLQSTLSDGETMFLVWTRLSADNAAWIINASDGVDVWRLVLDYHHLHSYKQLAEVDKYETYFTQFRTEFQSGNLTITKLSNKVVLTVGTALTYDLYEANTSDGKAELQKMLFRMAEDIAVLTQKLKVSTDSFDRLKNQKEDTNAAISIFDIPHKKPSAPAIKRKQESSLINPGSRNADVSLPTAGEPSDSSDSVHVSVLSESAMLDVFRCPNPIQCPFPCEMSNRRYHCPLCDNRPQKPGRMRRHFYTMHAGKHVIEHEGYRILRCKLKCLRANGRLTDCSHYHCCLCGRVCLRKVHLCCHLQAHALGTAKDVDDDVMDASLAEEERDEEEVEDGDTEEKGELDSAVVAAAQMSHMACSGTGDEHTDNIVTLTEGTQVVYVQSVHNGDTLTVVPVSAQHSGGLHISQPQQITADVSSDDHLTSSLQVLTSSADVTPEVTTHEMGGQNSSVLVKHVELILEQGEGGVPVSQESTEHCKPTMNTADLSEQLTSYSEESGPSQTGKPATETHLHYDEHSYNEFTTQRDPALTAADMVIAVTAATNHELTNQQHVTEEPANRQQHSDELANQNEAARDLANQEQSVTVERLSAVTSALDVNCQQLIMSTPIATSQVQEIISDTPLRSVVTASLKPQLSMTAESATPFQSPIFAETPESDQPKQTTAENDTLLLLDKLGTPQQDDHVFGKLFVSSKPPVKEIYQHPSVIAEQDGLDVCRCKNTECDCRLYHCPLCTCLPNKPGRIKEHFKKIHSEDLIIRYQGFQMLRCKMGCCRPSGKRILNSHYHCCLCGCICISKSGVYEHVRTHHSTDSTKPAAPPPPASNKRHAPPYRAPLAKRRSLAETASKTEDIQQVTSPQAQRPLVLQIPSVPATTQGGEPQALPSTAQGNQMFAIHLPQTADPTEETPQGTPQQPLVILMPQQHQGQLTGQNQQPIVIVMPQGGGGGSQPVIVPVPQQSSTT